MVSGLIYAFHLKVDYKCLLVLVVLQNIVIAYSTWLPFTFALSIVTCEAVILVLKMLERTDVK